MSKSKKAVSRIGLSCALSTPFTSQDMIDLPAFSEHARWTLANGCDGVTVFGTTGEGASVSTKERITTMSYFAGAGFDMNTVTLGVAACTTQEVIDQCKVAYEANCRAILLAPPFYFSSADDAGLFRWYSAVFEGLGGQLRDIILYHIPSMTRVGISPNLVAKLKKAYPKAIIGVKDSSGSAENTATLLADHSDLQILVGDERQLANAVKHGAAGSICGLANLCPKELRPLAMEGKDNAKIHKAVDAVLVYAFMPAIKALLAHRTGYKGWQRMRPPLGDMSAAQSRKLVTAFDLIFPPSKKSK